MLETKQQKFLKYRRKVNLITMCLLAFTVVFCFVMPTSNAGILSTLQGIADTIAWLAGQKARTMDMNGYKSFATFVFGSVAYVPIAVATGKSSITGQESSTTQGLHNLMINIIGGDTGDISGSEIYQYFSAGILVLKGVAAMMMIIIAVSRLFNAFNKGQDQTSAIYKMLAEIGVAGIIIMNADAIFAFLSALGISLVQSFSSNGTGTFSEVATSFASALGINTADGNWTASCSFPALIGYWGYIAIPAGASIVAFSSAGMATISVLLEIVLRRIVAPFAIVDIYEEGLRSPGFRYIKKYLATVLKLVLIVIIATVLPTFAATIAISSDDILLSTIVIGVLYMSGGAAMSATDKIANDLVG